MEVVDVTKDGGHVLDGDLLPRFDVGLSLQVEGAVPQDAELGVTEGESLAGHSQTDIDIILPRYYHIFSLSKKVVFILTVRVTTGLSVVCPS